MRKLYLVLLVTLSCTGCAQYWQNRLNDFADVGKVGLGVGGALGVDAQVTDFIHPSFGLSVGGFFVGHENRDVSGAWTHLALVFPTATAMANIAGKDLPKEANGVTSAQVIIYKQIVWVEASRYMVWKDYYTITMGDSDPKPAHVSWARRMGVEATVSLLFVSARAGVNPAELLDFVLGFTTLDIAGDDKVEDKPEPVKGM